MSGLEMAMTHEQTDTKKEKIFCRKISEQTRRQKRNQVAEQSIDPQRERTREN